MKKSILLTLALSIMCLSCQRKTKEKTIAWQHPVANSTANNQNIKVAILLDTSNSMDGLIDQTKAELWEIVNELSYATCFNKQPNLEIAIYEYGNDNLYPSEGYTRKVLGFSQDLDEVSKSLFSLTTKGGSEYCGTVIYKALEHLDWGNNADDLKLLFIAGNEPFTQGSIDYRDAAAQAKEKDVIINTIFCGNYEQGIDTKWKDGAALTYGDYSAINHNQRTTHIASPYDDTILQLNIQLNSTYVPYGYQGKRKVAMQMQEDTNAQRYSKANAVSRTVSKSSHLYKNSTWDLVDAIEEREVDLEDISNSQLPEELQNKSPQQLKKYVQEQKTKRNKIQEEISKLNEKRRSYIASQSTTKENALGTAILKALRTQGEKKNFVWNL